MVPEWLTSRPIAHRGLHNEAAGIPENSLGAFAAAVAAGYPAELDVHMLADGEIVVFHDFDLRRLTGHSRPIESCTIADISPLRLAGTAEPIPTLRQVLDLVGGRVGLLIEIKNDRRRDRRCEQAVARILDDYGGPLAVQSFNPFSVAWFARRRPATVRGQLACKFKGEAVPWHRKLLLSNLAMNIFSRPDFIAYKFDELPRWAVSRCRRAGLPVLAWTIRSPQDRLRASAHCDNIIFESIRP